MRPTARRRVPRVHLAGAPMTTPQPAMPGSYGEVPAGFRLPAAAHPGPVRLQVSDLARSLVWYEKTLGLRVRGRDGAVASLGPHGDDRVLVELRERPGATPVPNHGRTGLFHFAILLPDRPSLGRFLQHLGRINARAGAADHLVSESLYLQDPDNLGIEVYADRPSDTWRRVGRELMMASDPLDAPGLVRAAGDTPWTGMPPGTVMGHVHLRVADIAAASAFYSGALGFDRMVWHYPGALFLAAGGYHHHLGTNIWAGQQSTPPGPGEAQLLEWTLELPDEASIAAAADSLARAGHLVERDGDGSILAHDPWRTAVRLRRG